MLAFGRNADTGKQIFFMQMPAVSAEGSLPLMLAVCPVCHWIHPVIETHLYDLEGQPVGEREILEVPTVPYILASHTVAFEICSGSGEEPISYPSKPN